MKKISRTQRSTAVAVAAWLAATLLIFAPDSHVSAQQVQGARAPVRDPAHTFRRFPKSWLEIKRENIVMQRYDFSCGAAALATYLTYHIGAKTSETLLLAEADAMLTQEEIIDRLKKGLTMTDLRRLAVRLGYPASIGKLSLQDLAQAKTPIIVGIIVEEYDHFVVYRGMDGKYIYLADPARGNLRIPIREFLSQWQQNLGLIIVPKDGDAINWSPLLVRPDEMALGELNKLYVRDRLTNGPGASGN